MTWLGLESSPLVFSGRKKWNELVIVIEDQVGEGTILDK